MPERLSLDELRATYRLPEEDEALLAECDLSYFRSSGPGGQHKNRTETAVRLFHRPTGITTIGRRERSQRRNLEDALTRLREKIARLLVKPKRRKPTRPSRASKEKRIEEKKQRGRLKRDRSGSGWD